MKYIIFGTYDEARQYASEHYLSRQEWLHIGSWDQCAGLHPPGYRTIVLPGASRQALAYWYRRQMMHGRSHEDQKEWEADEARRAKDESHQ